MHSESPEISIKPEILTYIGNFPVTNSYFTSLFVLVVCFIVAAYYYSQIHKTKKSLAFYVIHSSVKGLYSFFESILGAKVNTFFTLIGGLFIYILFTNWIGLLPGVGSILIEGADHHLVPLFRGNTADLNTTSALALVSFAMTQFYGVRYLGLFGYLGKFFNFSSVVYFFVGILELVSEFSRIISFSFRLFGNIFAGEVILTIMAFLVPVLVPFPFLMLEIFTGFIQALVFAMLTAVFINLAITKQH
ncbi:MAG: hypothetical protein RI947_1488 [Candidatus Parcubacteria bacterium]|jgi:F-type H+-transporting ATPase subunit a